jgi:hypothetical protein
MARLMLTFLRNEGARMKLSVFASCFALFLTLLSTVSAGAVETGFETGNTFHAVALEGRVHVSCNDPGRGQDSRFWNCFEVTLDPAEYAYFVTDSGGQANSLELTATWDNGKVVKKSVGFDPAKGRSSRRVNLWIQTLTQKPLLDIGENQIEWRLSRNKRVEREGRFTAKVIAGSSRACPLISVQSGDINDCLNPGMVCARYFPRVNWCQ